MPIYAYIRMSHYPMGYPAPRISAWRLVLLDLFVRVDANDQSITNTLGLEHELAAILHPLGYPENPKIVCFNICEKTN